MNFFKRLSHNINIGFLDHAFQMTSALGTAGFQTSDVDYWSPITLLLLTLGMILGGNTGSTTSGIKTFRFIGLIKGAFYFAVSLFFPKGKKLNFKINDKEYSKEESLNIYSHITVFVIIYFLLFWLFVVLIYYFLPSGYSLSQIIFETSSAYNNVGQSTGITGPQLNIGAKVTMIVAMIIGRIELIPIYLLAFIAFRKRNGNSH